MAEYGIPYMGSKDKICDKIIRIFPKADHFYDLFGGGFSVTHAVLLRRSRDYKHFHFNEIRPGICDLIKSAINGEFNYDKFKPQFISREAFINKKDRDPYIKMLWSFGNNGDAYLFSKEIEPYKKSLHNAVVFNELDDLAKKVLGMNKFKDGYSISNRRLFLRNRIEFFRLTKIPEFLVEFLNEKRLERLQQLERLEQLEQLQRLEFYSGDYARVPIKENSVIYCDPPYYGTAEYDGKFDHKSFLNWCDSQAVPVFISEYEIKDSRFRLIFKTEKRSMLSGASRNIKTEKIYVNKCGWEKYTGQTAELLNG